MPRILFVLAIAGVGLHSASAQSGSRPPVIDMHVHSTTTTPLALARLASLNVRYVFLAALQSDLAVWSMVDPERYLPALIFPCAGGRAPITGRPCFDATSELPDLEWLRRELRAGRIRGLGELEPQYLGMSPDDERLEPHWRLAEELDIPVGIHMGPGPPGAAYESSPGPFKSPEFRMAAGDPRLLEGVLLRHKRLRLFVMHAGWPRLGAFQFSSARHELRCPLCEVGDIQTKRDTYSTVWGVQRTWGDNTGSDSRPMTRANAKSYHPRTSEAGGGDHPVDPLAHGQPRLCPDDAFTSGHDQFTREAPHRRLPRVRDSRTLAVSV